MTCAFCGCNETRPTRWQNIFGSGASLIQCTDCGLKFYDKPGIDVFRFYNTPAYDDYIRRHIENGSPFLHDAEAKDHYETCRHNTYGKLLNRLRAHCKELDSIFEIGASWGLFLEVAKEHGVKHLAGCDLSGAAVAGARARGYDVQHAPFVDAAAPNGLDAIVSLDVIEHSEHPGAELRKAFSCLRPGGAILVKTFYDEWHDSADIDLTRNRTKTVKDYLSTGYFGASHIFHFETDVLAGCLERVGFRIVEINHHPSCGQVEVYGVKS